MTILSLNNVGITSPSQLFKNITLSVQTQDHIGLIAQNGAGKSTFLRCIAGYDEFTHGEITLSRGVKLGYMPQDLEKSLFEFTFYDAVLSNISKEDRDSESWRVDMLLDSFEVPAELRDMKVSALSGGWKRLMLLARVWITEPDMLLLDEPTNHLDLEKILLLENWLKTWAYSTPLIIASHDRSFLDNITNRTLFLRPEVSHVFALPFTRAKQELEHIDATLATEQERQLNEADRLRRQSSKLKNIGLNSGSDLLQKKQKQLRERAEKIEDSVNNLHKEQKAKISLSNSGTHAKSLIKIDDLSIMAPDGRKLFKIKKFTMLQEDRLVILGKNGMGKSTFIHILRKILLEGQERSEIQTTPSLITGYIDQALSDLPAHKTAFDYISTYQQNDDLSRSSLATAGINFDRQKLPMVKLSLGQQSRICLLALKIMNPNFYLMDEPTTHIDISGQEALASEIIRQKASCILVSHDRSFIQDVGTRFFSIENGNLVEIDSSMDYFNSL